MGQDQDLSRVVSFAGFLLFMAFHHKRYIYKNHQLKKFNFPILFIPYDVINMLKKIKGP